MFLIETFPETVRHMSLSELGQKVKWLGGIGAWEAQQDLVTCTCRPETQQHPGLHQKEVTSKSRKGILLHCSAPTFSTVSTSGIPKTRETLTCWSKSKGRSQRWSEAFSPMRKCWESWDCSAWRSEGSLVFQCLKGAYMRAGEGHFTKAQSDRTSGNGFQQKENRLN